MKRSEFMLEKRDRSDCVVSTDGAKRRLVSHPPTAPDGARERVTDETTRCAVRVRLVQRNAHLSKNVRLADESRLQSGSNSK
jgi:hypothetical protein